MFDQVVAGAVEHLEPDDPFRRSAMRQRRGYARRQVLPDLVGSHGGDRHLQIDVGMTADAGTRPSRS